MGYKTLKERREYARQWREKNLDQRLAREAEDRKGRIVAVIGPELRKVLKALAAEDGITQTELLRRMILREKLNRDMARKAS